MGSLALLCGTRGTWIFKEEFSLHLSMQKRAEGEKREAIIFMPREELKQRTVGRQEQRKCNSSIIQSRLPVDGFHLLVPLKEKQERQW